ncbi:undecaprenyldiphospho-muramoylpentapeptide beta-N-acetylglucosaminyltransferase [Nitrincola alkalilacustris]|uniref:undecaprenyldiphospho-muramoylpentapeptide beta-N-acetylglucosaminyltransferase n=1 Tax=Nitrincola alkalilacustris TaxID=1571224 RepID=UPI00124E4EB7|nr:undecaprenyldiphospho-muramoylpentapeptide beta-N-acetylglucosaminyltransferase [Nitrincola alkalilacustris]
MDKPKTLLVMAGGTGGHVFPALATAEELKKQGVHVEWLGTAKGIEARVIPAAGITLNRIEVTGLRGKGRISLLLAPFRLCKALLQARRVLKKLKPDAVLGMGGFASGPGGLAAWLQGVPVLIHEQNAIAGMTNRALSRFASRVLQAFPGAFKNLPEADCIGNPVRGPILRLSTPEQRMKDRQGPLRLLVVGGSLGAQALNQLLPQALALMPEAKRPKVWHQTGHNHLESTLNAYKAAGVDAEVVPFIERMDEAWGWADLVICRSGALTVSEVAIAGVAALFVPFPHAVDDHQTINAGFLVDAGAARMIQQSELTAEKLAQQLEELGQRELLLQMAIKARSLGRPDASTRLARACMEAMS